MTTRGYEVKKIEKTDEGHLLLHVHDFLKNKDEKVVLTELDQKKLRELLK